MSQLYARVFLRILDSSIAENFQLRHVFEDFLKLSEDGIIDVTREALSRRLNIPIDLLNRNIAELESPDLNSRDPEFEGRRLERLDSHRDWGWRILNWEKFESIKTKAMAAERQARRRKRVSGEPNPLRNGKDNKPDAIKIIALLNERSGREFRNSDASLTPVMARLAESDVTVEGVIKMVERQVTLWKGDCKMEEYLRPQTLFGKEKFNSYYAARELPVNKADGRNSHSGTNNSIFAIREIIKAKEVQCASLKLKYCSEVAGGDTWSDDKSKKEYFSIRREIKELNGRIANTQP